MKLPVRVHNSRNNLAFTAEDNPASMPTNAWLRRSDIRKMLSIVVCRLAAVLLLFHVIGSVPHVTGNESDGRYAILLVGASGNPDLQAMYLEETRKLHSALTGALGFPRDQVVVLFDDPDVDPDLIQHKSTRKGLEEAVQNLASRVKKEDWVFVFIEGHGSYDGKTYKLNLVGRYDPTAWELAAILYSIPAERFVVVNATSCSGGSLPAFSGEGKIVITATKSGSEKNQTHMGRYFVESLENNAADSDKDDRVSVMESFIYSKLKVEEYYKNEDNLQTEHCILDDNGDAQGQSDPNPESEEGLLARTTFFNRGVGTDALEAFTPEQRKLALEAWELEEQIEALIYEKAKMPQSEYEKKLEELLLKLARINEKLER